MTPKAERTKAPSAPTTTSPSRGARALWWTAWLSSLTLLCLLLGNMLAPFVFAFVLAWMLNPLCARITRHFSKIAAPSFARAIAALLLTLALLALLVLLLSATLPALLRETLELMAALPNIATTLQHKAQQLTWIHPWQQLLLSAWESVKELNPKLNGDLNLDVLKALPPWSSLAQRALPLLSQALQTLTQQTSSIVAALSWFVLVPFATFYLLKDWTQVMQACRKRIPHSEEHLLALFRRIDETLSALLRGQAAVLGTMALFYATLLSLTGLPYGFAIGIAAGLAMVLPYVGTLLGAGIALIVAYAHAGFALPLLLTALVFVAGQLLESYFLTPRWIGKRVGLHPLWVVFFVLAGGEIAGFTGILLALPVGATIRAVVAHIDEHTRKP